MAGLPLGLIVIAGVAAAAEAFARSLKLADYPLYVRSEAVGYHFRPGWRTRMRGRYRWRTNAMGLRTDHDRAPTADSIVLLGDSTVESGVHVDQDETLAAQLARATGRDVHPVACPAWSLENQLAFVRENPSLYDAGTMVFVTNTWDLTGLARWETESAQPTRPPVSHAWYKLMRATHLQRRRWFPALFPPWPDDADGAWQNSLRDFLARYRGRVVCLFYPLREELAHGLTPCAELRPLVEGRAETFEIGAMPEWSADCYADAVHPNERGRAVLLQAVRRALAVSGVSRQARAS